MRLMLARMRALAPGWRGRDVLVLERDGDGLRTWIRIPDLAALLEPAELTAVGFFGVARADMDHGPIDELEARIVETLGRIPGLLSYFNLELPGGRYGNLILCADREIPERWHAHELHQRAVELAPRHYSAARLHRGVIRSGLLGEADLEPVAQRDLDFETGYTAATPPT